MDATTVDILEDLIRAAGLPGVTATSRLAGRGLANRLYAARLADGRQLVLRIRSRGLIPERARAQFLQTHGLAVPQLFAASGNASLYGFAPGVTLSDAVEDGTATANDWAKVGRAYRQVHDVRFPRQVEGTVGPDLITLRPADPVADLHATVERSVAGLERLLPETVALVPELHRLIDAAAPSLRSAATTLLHGDVTLWNILIAPSRATLVDWDEPAIGDPARELALLDQHASLFNGKGLPRAFYNGYGRGPIEPNTSLHRLIGTIAWLTSDDWVSFERLDPDLRARTRGWFRELFAWTTRMPEHIERLRTLPPRP